MSSYIFDVDEILHIQKNIYVIFYNTNLKINPYVGSLSFCLVWPINLKWIDFSLLALLPAPSRFWSTSKQGNQAPVIFFWSDYAWFRPDSTIDSQTTFGVTKYPENLLNCLFFFVIWIQFSVCYRNKNLICVVVA